MRSVDHTHQGRFESNIGVDLVKRSLESPLFLELIVILLYSPEFLCLLHN